MANGAGGYGGAYANFIDNQREQEREPLIDFEQLEIQTEAYHPDLPLKHDNTCTICLDDFKEGD